MKKYCIACGFPKVEWRDYQCPLCFCPQRFIFGVIYENRLRQFFNYYFWIQFKSWFFWTFQWRNLKKYYAKMAYLHVENGVFAWPKKEMFE